MTREPCQSFFHRFLRCERGDPIVEFILVLPLMLILGFGVMEIGRILLYQHFIIKGVRDGTRYLTRVPLADLADLGVNVNGEEVQRGKPTCTMTPGTPIAGDPLDVATCLALGGPRLSAAKDDGMTVRVELRSIDSEAFYGPDRIVRMTAEVPVDFPILDAFLDTDASVTFTVFNEARHIGQ
jgi:hypothetical protein